MAREGWIKLYHQLEDSQIWREKPFDRARAWVDLLLLATYKEEKLSEGYDSVKLNPGDILSSQLKLGKRWGWSRKKVKRFFVWLERVQQVSCQWTHKWGIISICNWERYQQEGTTGVATEGTTDAHIKEVKEVKNKDLKDPASQKSLAIKSLKETLRNEKLSLVNDVLKYTGYCLTPAQIFKLFKNGYNQDYELLGGAILIGYDYQAQNIFPFLLSITKSKEQASWSARAHIRYSKYLNSLSPSTPLKNVLAKL